MGVKCGKCGEELPNVVSQETLTERLRAKDEANAALKAELKELPKLREAAAERDRLVSERAAEAVANERTAAFTAAGVTDAAVQARMARLYAAEVDGVEDAPTLADWLASDDTRALFSAHLAPPKAAPAAPPAGAPKAAPQAAPPKGVPVAGAAPKATGAAPLAPHTGAAPKGSISDLLESQEYRRAKPKERQELLTDYRRKNLTTAGA